MGLKQRGSGSGSKAAPKSVSEGAEAVAGSGKTIKSEIERAQSVFRRGNHAKALKLVKDLCTRHQSSALAHHARGAMLFNLAALIHDPIIKQRHLKNAVDPAWRARLLSPKSFEYAHFYAHLLFELADDKESYQKVLRECQRALELLQEGDQSDESMSQSRKAEFHQDLEALVKKSKMNMYSTVMKKLGIQDFEGKFKFDPKEEKKKLRSGTEGRKREIEGQTEAARVRVKALEALPLEEEEEEEMSSRALRLERRKKFANIKKMVSLGDRIIQVEKYWNSLSSDMKRGLLRVKITDLRAYFSSSKDDLAAAVLSEAIAFAEKNRTWKFMACCVCDEKFTDLATYVEHFTEEHVGKLSLRMQKVMPQEIDSDWIMIIEKGKWKPVDTHEVFQISEDQMRNRFCSVVESGTMIDMDDYLDSYSRLEMKTRFDEELMEMEIDNLKDEDKNQEPGESDGPGWPLSDDAKRASTLEGIQSMFRMLLRQRHLTTRHIVQVMQYTMDELQIFAPASQLLNHGLDHTPLCICFLAASQLEKVLRFLQSIACICAGNCTSTDAVLAGEQVSEIKERIVFSRDSSCLLLDKGMLRGELNLSTSSDTIEDDGSAVTSADDDQDDMLLDGDSLVSWLFSGCSVSEQLASWTCLREEKKHQGMKLLDILEKEFCGLEYLCQKKCKHSIYEDALQAIERVCLEESKRRAQDPQYLPQYYEYLLEKQRRVVEVGGADTPFSNKFELDLISNILKDVHAMSVNLLSSEASPSPDQEHLEKSDMVVEEAIRRYEVQITLELCRIDARITRVVTAMEQQDLKLGDTSALDYRSILVTLLKSFIRARLEDLVDKDAIQKSDAARDALLAQLALDGEKDTIRGSQTKGRQKDKKKNKSSRKAKTNNGGNGQLLLHVEEDNIPNSKIDEINHPGEEERLQLELETEERKRKEILDFQLQIENESRRKHQASQINLGEMIEQISCETTKR